MNFLLKLSRAKKRFISVIIDAIFIVFSFYTAYWVRIGDIESIDTKTTPLVLFGVIFITIASFIRLGLYRAILRYLTFHALAAVAIGTLISSACVSILAFYFNAPVPRSVPIIYGTFLCIACGGSRVVVRGLVASLNRGPKKRILIYGAGSAGRQLANALKSSDGYKVIGFLDRDKNLEQTILLGLPVFPVTKAHVVVSKFQVDQILLAVPSASRSQRRQILDSLIDLPAEVLTVPNMQDIVEGRAKIDELKDVEIEDLLGRDPVSPQQTLMQAHIKGKNVLVTGAGGSIGSELCRQIVSQSPSCLILFDISEFALYQIHSEINELIRTSGFYIEVVPLLGSVQKSDRLKNAMASFNVHTVYHAAAYKHVPLVEFNVIEGVRNNIFGTFNVAKAAAETKVELFVLISTDKAVRPTNVMGATKRMAELGLQALSQQSMAKNKTKFCMVRFGNVLGSSGSVIPLFKKQIDQGGPVTVTHPEIIRYFMTIPEAAQLVIQAGALAKGGDVFVLDMGNPVKIVDLAKNLIRLSGLDVKNETNPYGDIEITFSGLRPGEKLYEELLISDNVEDTTHPRIMTANEVYLPLTAYNELIHQLSGACERLDQEAIRQLLLDAPTGFTPKDGICDIVWSKQKEKENTIDNVLH